MFSLLSMYRYLSTRLIRAYQASLSWPYFGAAAIHRDSEFSSCSGGRALLSTIYTWPGRRPREARLQPLERPRASGHAGYELLSRGLIGLVRHGKIVMTYLPPQAKTHNALSGGGYHDKTPQIKPDKASISFFPSLGLSGPCFYPRASLSRSSSGLSGLIRDFFR